MNERIPAFFNLLDNETNITTPSDLTGTEVWITMSLGTIGLIISIIITIFCFRENPINNESRKISNSPLLKESSETTPLSLHANT